MERNRRTAEENKVPSNYRQTTLGNALDETLNELLAAGEIN